MCRYTTLWKKASCCCLLSVWCAHEQRSASLSYGFGRCVEAGCCKPGLRWSRRKGERHLLPWRVPVTAAVANDVWRVRRVLHLQQDSAPAHRARDTVRLLELATPAGFYSAGSVAAKQSRPQSSWLQDMERRPAASVSVMGVQRRRIQAAFGARLARHRPDHHWQCNWRVAWPSSWFCPAEGWTL